MTDLAARVAQLAIKSVRAEIKVSAAGDVVALSRPAMLDRQAACGAGMGAQRWLPRVHAGPTSLGLWA